MKSWVLYSLTIAVFASLLVMYFIFADSLFFSSMKNNLDKTQSRLAQNAPAIGLKTNTHQLDQVITELKQQQSLLFEKLTQLDKQIKQISTKQLGKDDASYDTGSSNSLGEIESTLNGLIERLNFIESRLDDGSTLAVSYNTITPDDRPYSINNDASASLNQAFDSETRSHDWADEKELELTDQVFNNERVQTGHILFSECRSSICRLTIQFDSEEERDLSVEIIPAIFNFEGDLFIQPIEGTTEMDIYIIDNTMLTTE